MIYESELRTRSCGCVVRPRSNGRYVLVSARRDCGQHRGDPVRRPASVRRDEDGNWTRVYDYRVKVRLENAIGQTLAKEQNTRALRRVRKAEAARRTRRGPWPWRSPPFMLRMGRREVSRKIRKEVRARAGDRCEDCGGPLQAVRETEYPEQWRDRVVLEVRIDYPCHRCGFRFPVVDAGWLEDDALGRRIQERFPAFYKDYSRTTRSWYWANHCPECDALQGAWHVMGSCEPPDERGRTESLVITPWAPKKVRERYVHRETVAWGNVHHLDENPANNDPSNLRLLCVRCHAGRHGRLPKRESGGAVPNRR